MVLKDTVGTYSMKAVKLKETQKLKSMHCNCIYFAQTIIDPKFILCNSINWSLCLKDVNKVVSIVELALP